MPKTIVLCLLVLCIGAGRACATDWSWLEPGKTLKANVIGKAGEPLRAYAAQAIRGLLDLDLPAPDAPRGLRNLALDPDRIDVEVLVYAAGEPADQPDRLVFLQDRLLYAVVRTPESERTLPSPGKENRAEFREVFFQSPVGGGFRSYWVSIPEGRNVGYVQLERAHWNVPGPALLRVSWADPREFPELKCPEWSWQAQIAYDWSWVRPGTTRKAEVLERAGMPLRTQADVLVVKGLVDIDFGSHTGGGGVPIFYNPTDPRIATVELLEYDHGDTLAILADRVLYLRTLPPADERTQAGLAARFGEGKASHVDRVKGCILERLVIAHYPGERLAFVAQQTTQGLGEYVMRLAWPAPGDLAAELGEIDWRLPAGPNWWMPPPGK